MVRSTVLAIFSIAVSALILSSNARVIRLHRDELTFLTPLHYDALSVVPIVPPLNAVKASSVIHAVEDVGPAVKNATELALLKAEHILKSYSNTLRIVSIPVGLLVTFAGYFLFTPVLFAAGFLSGAGISFIATRALFGAETPAAAWISIAAMLVGGAVVALIATRLLAVGMFAIGATLGVVIASALSPSVLGRIYPANTNVGFYVGAVVLGVVLGLVAMQFQRQMVIIATAYGGSFAFFFGIGYFAGHFPTTAELSMAERGNFTTWFVMYSLMTILFGSVGALIQLRVSNGRPFVRPRRIQNERNSGHGSWWGARNDETANLPQNESGKEGDGKEFNSVITAREVFLVNGNAAGLSGGGTLANSLREGGMSDLGKQVTGEGATKGDEMGQTDIVASEKAKVSDGRIVGGESGRKHRD